jgi:S1-C subfamily serine protease
MTAMHEPYGQRGAPGPRRPEDLRPAVDPWETGEHIFRSEWDTAERRALDVEWLAGQQSRFPQRPAHVGHPRPARAAHAASVPPRSFEPAPDPRSRGRGGKVALVIAILVVIFGGFLVWRLESGNSRLSAELAAERDRSSELGDRTDKLEKQLAGVFDPEAVSSGVLPSVFRVRAGDFTGTAFSIGSKAASGKANMLTNYHVVESVWEAGDKKVFLERGTDEVDATIVKVDKEKDLALLSAARTIKGLKPASAAVKPGQQIVVVGAPLGLEDTVTTGVVSAYRPSDQDAQSIQFDAPINPGNSGGPVVNANQQVIGLATAKARDAEGIGLAIAIKDACDTFKVC